MLCLGCIVQRLFVCPLPSCVPLYLFACVVQLPISVSPLLPALIWLISAGLGQVESSPRPRARRARTTLETPHEHPELHVHQYPGLAEHKVHH